MKFPKSLQVLGAVLFIAFQFSGLWAGFHSVSFGDNGTVYYASGATQEEAQKLATYLEQAELDNADMKLERDSESETLVMKFIPATNLTTAALLETAQNLEQNVFGEHVIVEACDDKFRTLYKSENYSHGLPALENLSQNL